MKRKKQILFGAGIFLLILLLLSGIFALCRPGDTLRVACQNFTGNFSPFFADTKTDMEVVDLCFDRLITLDRAGNVLHNASLGEQTMYDGIYYTYYGIADLKIQYDEIDDQTTYIWTLGENVRFQDGVFADADDIIFSYYVYLDPAYNGPYAVYSVPIVGLEAYRTGSISFIEGIRRIDSKSVAVTVEGSNPDDVRTLGITLCPLHYYGDPGQYNLNTHQFGFTRGDLSEIEIKSGSPLGSGPYRPVHTGETCILFRANRFFYAGEPACRRLELICCSDAECAAGITSGKIDIAEPTLSATLSSSIRKYNINNNLSGNRIRMLQFESNGYGYIGIHAKNVSVGANAGSYASCTLRRAFATVFTVFRQNAVQAYFGEDLPFGEEVYSLDSNGNQIFTETMSPEIRIEAAKAAAIKLLIQAGFTYNGEYFIAAPEGAKLHYTALVPAEGWGDHPCYAILQESASLFSELGLTLEIQDIHDQAQLWQVLDAGEAEIWCAAWDNPDAYQLYHSANLPGHSASTGSNYYAISDTSLDRLLSAPTINAKACRRIVDTWAVEVPVYRRTGCVLYSAERITAGMVHNPGIYHGWLDEIANIRKS